MTAKLDKVYMDRLSGLLAEADFERIYKRIRMEREALEEELRALEAQRKCPVSTEDRLSRKRSIIKLRISICAV